MIDLFSTGVYEYPNNNLEKPVKIRETDLQQIASSIQSIPVFKNHNTTESLGELTNFIVEDGTLKVDTPNFDFGGYGFSPGFIGDLIQDGDYYVYNNIRLHHVARTKNPKNGIIHKIMTNNSNGDDGMSQEIIQEKDKLIAELQKENTLLKRDLEEAEKQIKEKTKIEKKLEETNQQMQTITKETEAYKQDAEAYREYVQNEKDKIIKEFVGDDNEGYEHMKDMSLEQLKYFQSKQKRNDDVKPHIPTQGVQNQGDINQTVPQKTPDKMTYEERKAHFSKITGGML